MTAVKAWAIKAPDGSIILKSLGSTKDAVENKFLQSQPAFRIFTFEAEGYRCVRVRVEEIENNTSSRKE